jgi:imidazolonepropionase-like amidohydrolase
MTTDRPNARNAWLALLLLAAGSLASAQTSEPTSPAPAASAEQAGNPAPATAPAARSGEPASAGAHPASRILAIRSAHVHPVVGPELRSGTVLIENGKITAVGAELPVPDGAQVFDARGLHLYPGLVDADTTLGLVEVSTVRGSVDLREIGAINPNIQAELGVNPGSHLIPVARTGGVLTALVIPEGELLAGTAALMNLAGWTWEEMLVRPRAGMHLVFPASPPIPPWMPQKSEEEKKKEREKRLAQLDQVFDDADAYAKAREAAAGAGRAPVPADMRLDALLPVLRGETPLIVSASDLPTIKSALEWAEKRQLRIILRGAADAWRIADVLAEKQIPVLLHKTLSLPRREDAPYDTPFTTARKLHAAGVPFALTSGGDADLVMNLSHQAAMAAAFGLDRAAALEAITIAPARILGAGDRLGSIEPGKDANLILTDGDLLEVRTRVLAGWIAGEPADLRSKHQQLYELYRSRPRRTPVPEPGR